jgi:predicted RecA/RadA family phage recombinase
MFRGDDRTFLLDVAFDGEATDLSSALDMKFTAKQRVSDQDADAVVVLAWGDGVELVTDGTDGQVAVSIPAIATQGLRSGAVLTWDLEVTAPLTSGGEAVVRTWPEVDGIPTLGKLVVTGDVSGAVPS